MTAPSPASPDGKREFRAALRSGRGLFLAAAGMSCVVNLLMLTGPLFMLQVYDRVLASKSLPTLQALFVLVTVLFLAMGLLDFLRGRVLAIAGARVQALLDGRIFAGSLRAALSPAERARPATALRDLDAVQGFLSGPAPHAFFDMPWVPVYLGVIVVLHPWLGFFAAGAALVLLALATANQMATREPEDAARAAATAADKAADTARREAETLHALGMAGTMAARWGARRGEALTAQMVRSGRAGLFQSMSKALRLFLQSAILALGAWLAVTDRLSPGAMIASSILMGRALAPLDQAIGQWRVFLRAWQARGALQRFLAENPPPEVRTALPVPAGRLTVEGLAVMPPGARQPTLRGVAFDIRPGEAVGVIGPSASGKSTLARALTGIWPPAAGDIRLGGAAIDQWSATGYGRLLGYLPQEVGLFDGTVAQNIARFRDDMPPEETVRAASRAGAHEMILRLPDGYDTQIGEGGARLSGGQRQRVGLARALFGDPVLLIFDEPNANLDAEGEEALLKAIRHAKARERAVLVMAHRPGAIALCERLLVLRGGTPVAFGPRDAVLARTTQNHAPPAVAGGAA